MSEGPGAGRRSYAWEDPSVAGSAAAASSGLGFLHDLVAGRVPAPPALVSLGIEAVSAADGRAGFDLVPAPWQLNLLGTVHGGVLTALADTAMGSAVQTRLAVGNALTSIELKVNFVRPVTLATGVVHGVGELLSLGRRTATAFCRLTDDGGRLLGHGTTTCMLFPIERPTSA